MQMCPGRAARIADEADQLAPAYPHARFDVRCEFGEVTVDRRELAGVIDADPVAIAAVGRCAHHDAIGSGVHRRADRGDEIDALMHEQPPRTTWSRRGGCSCMR